MNGLYKKDPLFHELVDQILSNEQIRTDWEIYCEEFGLNEDDFGHDHIFALAQRAKIHLTREDILDGDLTVAQVMAEKTKEELKECIKTLNALLASLKNLQ
jgi:hypothetical protein